MRVYLIEVFHIIKMTVYVSLIEVSFQIMKGGDYNANSV